MTCATDSHDIETFERLLAARFSCRAFRPDPVPRAVIARILGAAQKTASWCNSQPWQVAVLSGEARRGLAETLSKAASENTPVAPDFPFPREYRGVYLERRRESGFQLYNTLGIARGDKAGYKAQMLENFRFFGAPHVAIVTTDEALGVYGAVDCGGYVGNFMLAARALGIATVPQAAPAGYASMIRAHLGVGDDRRVVCAISFGYADDSHLANGYRTTRAAVEDAVTFLD
jgi:nitroreductase